MKETICFRKEATPHDKYAHICDSVPKTIKKWTRKRIETRVFMLRFYNAHNNIIATQSVNERTHSCTIPNTESVNHALWILFQSTRVEIEILELGNFSTETVGNPSKLSPHNPQETAMQRYQLQANLEGRNFYIHTIETGKTRLIFPQEQKSKWKTLWNLLWNKKPKHILLFRSKTGKILPLHKPKEK
jgi:hypothetical protein